MRLVIMSDTHNRRTGIEVPPCDVLIHCGDLTGSGSVDEITAVNKWLGTFPAKYRIVIAGNHDRFFESNPSAAIKLLTNAIYLKDSFVTINGVKFYGSPYTPTFFNWSFMRDRGPSIKEKWDLIPNDVDVLITHGPPFGILDYSKFGNMRAGCEDLLAAVERVKPSIHCFGHLHAGYGIKQEIDTLFVNAAVLNDNYEVARKPWVIDIDPKTKELRHNYTLDYEDIFVITDAPIIKEV